MSLYSPTPMSTIVQQELDSMASQSWDFSTLIDKLKMLPTNIDNARDQDLVDVYDDAGYCRMKMDEEKLKIMDAMGREIVSIGYTIEIGPDYVDAPLDMARQFFEAIKLYRVVADKNAGL